MRHHSNRSKAAFTLVELLTVIAIIGILAVLVTGGVRKAAEGRKIGRVKADLANLESMIEAYKNDQGFYPPNSKHPDGRTKAEMPPLYYELTGTRYDGTQYRSLSGDKVIADADMKTAFELTGFANSNPETAKNYAPNLKANQYAAVNGDIQVLIVAVEGPADPQVLDVSGKAINTWRYASDKPTNNVSSYDLWADIVVGSKNMRFGNWKE